MKYHISERGIVVEPESERDMVAVEAFKRIAAMEPLGVVRPQPVRTPETRPDGTVEFPYTDKATWVLPL